VTAPGPGERLPPPVELDDPYAEPPTAAAFAAWLRGQREVRGLSRAEIAGATKLAPTVVAALESGDPGRMPPRAYVHGYLRTYAGALGLDPDELLLRWQEVELVETRPDAEPARPRLVLGTGSRLPLAAALGAVAAAGAAAAVWLLR
jgi:cytoskeletal protein RodZ